MATLVLFGLFNLDNSSVCFLYENPDIPNLQKVSEKLVNSTSKLIFSLTTSLISSITLTMAKSAPNKTKRIWKPLSDRRIRNQNSENTQKMLFLLNFWIFKVFEFSFLNNCLFLNQHLKEHYYICSSRSKLKYLCSQSWNQNLDLPLDCTEEIIWNIIVFHLCRLSVTTVFVFSLHVSIERVELLPVQRTVKLFVWIFFSEYKLFENNRKR